MAINIQSIEEYNLCVENGFCPLMDARFHLDIHLRVEIQKQIFSGKIPIANEKFYKFVWRNKPHICEETGKPLNNYSSCYVSHILSRGAFPEMAHDPRNINILCLQAHNEWENGKRETMRIYAKNKQIIELLKNEYNALRNKN